MIYYLKKQEVKIGEKVKINDISITLTQQIIDDNPELFEVKSDDIQYFECIKKLHNNPDPIVGEIYKATNADCNGQSAIHGICMVGSDSFHSCFKPSTKEAYEEQGLIKEAKKRYPAGTRFYWEDCKESTFTSSGKFLYSSYGISSDCIFIYQNGEWAEIAKPLFVTDDGVDIYEGDECWWMTSSLKIRHITHCNKENSGNVMFKHFSTEQAAKKWIEENEPKEKTLEDYENILLKAIGSEMINRHFVYNDGFYQHLKHREPKLYYTKVLQLIADDLNGDWKTNFTDGRLKCTISSKYDINGHCGVDEGAVYFKTRVLVVKAIEIMGDKLDYIFK